MSLYNLNGEKALASQLQYEVIQRATLYGDGFFETLIWTGGKVRFGKEHVQRIHRSLDLLGLESTEEWTVDYLESLIRKWGILSPLRVRVVFFRKAGGLYKGEERQAHFFLEADTTSDELFLNNDHSPEAFICNQPRKYADEWSGVKSISASIYTQAAHMSGITPGQDLVLLNHHGRVCEGLMSNIFVVEDEQILTPELSEGCVDGVMRRCLLNQFDEIVETTISVEQLMNASEVFMTNAGRGIYPLSRIENHDLEDVMTRDIQRRFRS